MLFKSIAVWLMILTMAVANGLLREKLFVPRYGEVAGFLMSGVLLCLFILVITYLTLPWIGAQGAKQVVLLGAGWLVMTLIFEFAFGLARGASFIDMLDAFTFKNGNLWSLILIFTAVSPWVVAKLRGML